MNKKNFVKSFFAILTFVAPAYSEETKPLFVEDRLEESYGVSDSASEGTIPYYLFTERPILRVGELLEVVPGFVATQHSGTGKANQYFLRGFNLDHGTDFNFSVNGMPINQPTHGHGQGYADLNFIIPELVEKIEYKKGVYYPEVGDFSSAGAAEFNMFSTLREGFATVAIGEYGYYRGVTAKSQKLGAGEILLGGEFNFYNGPWDLKESQKKFNGFANYFVGEKDKYTKITAMAYNSTWNSSDQIPLRAVENNSISEYGNIDPTDGGKSSRYSISGEYFDKTQHGSDLANLYLISSRLKLFSNFTYFLDNPEQGDQFAQEDERVTAGGKYQKELFNKTLDLPSKTKFGINTRNDYIPNITLRKTQARQDLSTVRDDEVFESTIGTFVQHEIDLTPKLRASAGLRGDAYYFDVNSTNNDNSGNKLAGILSPKGTLTYTAREKLEFYLNGGLGYHSNDARGVVIRKDPVTGAATDRVDPLVRSKGGEVGTRFSAVDGLNQTLALWMLDVDSELLFIGDAGNTEASRPSRRYGVELSNVIQPTKWIRVDGDYSLSKSYFKDSDPTGDEIPGSIENVVAGGIALTPTENLAAELRIRYFGPRPLIENNSVRSDSTTLVNAGISYRMGQAKLSLQLLNLFDSREHDLDYYYTSRLQGEGANGTDDIHFHPVEPRNLRAGLTYFF